MSTYAVLQTRWEPLEAESLAPVLARTLGLVPYDAMRAARDAHGILAERLPRPKADALAAACEAEGIAARVVPQEGLSAVGVPTLVRSLTIRADGFGVVLGYTGPPRTLPWPALRLLSAGAVGERREGARALAGKPKRRGSLIRTLALHAVAGPILGSLLARAMQPKSSTGGARAPVPDVGRCVEMADLFVTEGGGTLHLRLRAPDLYYAQILGAQDPHDIAIGFRLVLARVAERATAAIASPTVEAILREPGPDRAAVPDDAQFTDVHEFTQYNRWLLQLLA